MRSGPSVLNAAERRSLALAVAFCVVAAYLLPWVMPAPVADWNRRATDSLLHLRNRFIPPVIDSRLALVLLDDTATARFANRNEERAFLARLVTALRHLQAERIVLDLLFMPMGEGRPDSGLGQALRHPEVIAALALVPEGVPQTPAALPGGVVVPHDSIPGGLRRGAGVMPFDPVLTEHQAALGLVNVFPDPDGLFRRYPLLMRLGEGWVPSLALRAAAQQMQVPLEAIRLTGSAVILPGALRDDGARADLIVPVNRRGELLLNIPGTWDTAFPRYSAARLAAEVSRPESRAVLREELAGGIILVADSSTAGRDTGPIAGDPAVPLSLLHATALNDMLTGAFLREPPWPVQLLEPLALGGILFWCACRFSGGRLALACGLLSLAWAVGGMLLLVRGGVVLALLPAQCAIAASFAAAQRLHHLRLRRDRERLHDRFGRYFSPALLEKIMAAPELLHSFERKELTILFCDIVGFTAWCEQREPEEVRGFLNRWYGELSNAVFRQGGTVGKFIGDGFLAYFGDPAPQADHAARAVAAAYAIQRAATDVAPLWQAAAGAPSFSVRVGLHTGEVVVGNLGSETLMEYTVVGTAVNLASRLEGLAPPGGILASAAVRAAVGDTGRFAAQGTVSVKGATEPLAVYRVMTAPDQASSNC